MANSRCQSGNVCTLGLSTKTMLGDRCICEFDRQFGVVNPAKVIESDRDDCPDVRPVGRSEVIVGVVVLVCRIEVWISDRKCEIKGNALVVCVRGQRGRDATIGVASENKTEISANVSKPQNCWLVASKVVCQIGRGERHERACALRKVFTAPP